MVKPLVVFGSETGAMAEMDMWERMILRKINGPVVEQGIWRIWTNQESRELYKDLDVAPEINTKRFELSGGACKNGLGKDS